MNCGKSFEAICNRSHGHKGACYFEAPDNAAGLKDSIELIIKKWDDGKGRYRERAILLEIKAVILARAEEKELCIWKYACPYCLAGFVPIRSSVSEAMVHPDTPVGRVICKGRDKPTVLFPERIPILTDQAAMLRNYADGEMKKNRPQMWHDLTIIAQHLDRLAWVGEQRAAIDFVDEDDTEG